MVAIGASHQKTSGRIWRLVPWRGAGPWQFRLIGWHHGSAYPRSRRTATAITAAADLVQGPIVISGHSAGGHLAARMLCRGVLPEQVAKRVRHGAPISALSDLRPLMHTAMNSDLQIDPNEAMAESPALISDRIDADCTVWVGAEERPALLDQSRWLAEAWDADLRIAPGRHHFDVIADLTDPDSPLVRNMLGVG